MTTAGDGWLREAMQLILADLDGTAPLVLTVITYHPDGGQLTQVTASSRAPGRLYRTTLTPEEPPRDDTRPRP